MYLDYNATTPMDPGVITAVTDAMRNGWANPSSRYEDGMTAKAMIAEARDFVAGMLGADSEDVIFTSGGTEANSMVLNTVVKYFRAKTKDDKLPHVITSNLEHDSVRIVLEKFVEEGIAEVTFVPASLTSGRVEVDAVTAAVKSNTCLVSIMMANNETGIIQPVEDISRAVKAVKREILVHTDAAQSIGKVPVNVQDLAVDYLTVVGHKFYGPRIGALYVRKPGTQTPLLPLFVGGGQERSFRSGTENTPMIVGLGMAARLVSVNLEFYERTMRLNRDRMESSLQEMCSQIKINGKYPSSQRLPNTLNFSFLGRNLSGQSVLQQCADVQAGVGAACHSTSSVRASPVLLASGVEEDVARNAIRLSFGRDAIELDGNGVHPLDAIASRLCAIANALQ